MKRRNALNLVGISLAIGLLSLAACAPNSGSASSNNSSAAKVGSSSNRSEPEQHFAANAPVDSTQSQALTNYLHTHQLPLVGGRVLSSSGGSRQVILYGFVATPFGRADAADRSREFLNDSGAQVDNRIKVEPDLAANPGGNPPAVASGGDSNNPDIQNYENQQDQQLTQQQQQQYMNQGGMGGMGSMGGSGLMMVIPFLLGGSLGGGGSSFGFGTGGGMGGNPYGYGSPYGGGGYPSPYGYPPSSGYGSPYGP